MATYRKTRSGKWEVRVAKKGHKPLYATFRTKAMAEDWARKKEDMIVQGTLRDYAQAETAAVSAVLTKYGEELSSRKASEAKELSRIRILARNLGHLTLIELTPEQVVGYVDDRLDSVSSDTVRKELGTLSQVIKTARVLWKIQLPENPVTTAREILSVTKTLQPGNARVRRLEKGEYKRLMRAANPLIKPIIRFAIETAMRRGEIINARREHINNGLLLIPETKTDKPRTIPLTKAAKRLIMSLPVQIDGYLFSAKHPDSITDAFSEACKKANIKNLRFHDLRHEGVSRLFEKGLEIHEVAAISGHSDWRTLKRYTHVLPGDIAKKLA